MWVGDAIVEPLFPVSPPGGDVVDIRSAIGGIGSGEEPSKCLIAADELTLLSLVRCCGPIPSLVLLHTR